MSTSSYNFSTDLKAGLTSIGEGLRAIARAIESKSQPTNYEYSIHVNTTGDHTAEDIASTIKDAMSKEN